MFTILALIACGPGTVTLDDDVRRARPDTSDTVDAIDTSDSGDTDDSGLPDDSGDTSGNVGWANVDDDVDGFTEEQGDCDDDDAAIHPGAEEIWYDGVNQNCDDYSDYDQDGDGDESWSVNDGTDCDDDDDRYDAVGCPGGNADRPDCDDRYSNVNPEVHEDNTDGMDNNCNGTTDGLDINIEWELTYGCPPDITCVDSRDYDYFGTMTVTITDDFPDMLVLLGAGGANTAEQIDLGSFTEAQDVRIVVPVVAGNTANSGATSLGDDALISSYLYMSGAGHEATNGSRCIVWGPQAAVLSTAESYADLGCVDITDLVYGGSLEDGDYRYVLQSWDGYYE